MENQECEKKVTIKVFIDIVLAIIVFLPTALFFLVGHPFKRGFFCDDESIAHPYKQSTIGDVMLVCLGIGIPFVAVIGSEIFIYKYRSRRGELVCKGPVRNRFRFGKWRVNRCFAEMYINIGMFLFGAAASQSTTDIMKYSIGLLRPHFLDVCKPNWDEFNCTDQNGYMRYVEDYECTGDSSIIEKARLSHPSGHASFSSYCMIYLALYIHKKMTWKGSKLLKTTLQIMVVYLSFYTGLSRISDYKHHWSDVLMGFFLGSLFAIINVCCLTGLYKQASVQDLSHKVLQLEQLNKSHLSSGSPNTGQPHLHSSASIDNSNLNRRSDNNSNRDENNVV